MAYVTAEARQELLDAIAGATDDIGVGLAALGEVYEQLDDITADRLEEQLFRPVQLAYGRLQRTHNGFGERHGLPARAFSPASLRLPSTGVKGLLDAAVAAIAEADAKLSALQDSMMPIEVGDPELRSGLTEVRTLLGDLPARARQLVRTFGR